MLRQEMPSAKTASEHEHRGCPAPAVSLPLLPITSKLKRAKALKKGSLRFAVIRIIFRLTELVLAVCSEICAGAGRREPLRERGGRARQGERAHRGGAVQGVLAAAQPLPLGAREGHQHPFHSRVHLLRRPGHQGEPAAHLLKGATPAAAGAREGILSAHLNCG